MVWFGATREDWNAKKCVERCNFVGLVPRKNISSGVVQRHEMENVESDTDRRLEGEFGKLKFGENGID